MDFSGDDFAAVDIHDQLKISVLATHNGRTIVERSSSGVNRLRLCSGLRRTGHRAFLRVPAMTWFPLRLCLCGELAL